MVQTERSHVPLLSPGATRALICMCLKMGIHPTGPNSYLLENMKNPAAIGFWGSPISKAKHVTSRNSPCLIAILELIAESFGVFHQMNPVKSGVRTTSYGILVLAICMI